MTLLIAGDIKFTYTETMNELSFAQACLEDGSLVLKLSKANNSREVSAARLREELLQYVAKNQKSDVIIDLSHMKRVSSPLFAVLISAAMIYEPKKILLRNYTDHFKQSLSSLELENMFQFLPNE